MYTQNYQGYTRPNSQMIGQPQVMSPQQSMPFAATGLKGRPVSSLDEVRATTIDFDGSVFFFPDLANKKIYTKQINLDGSLSLNMYELKTLPMNEASGDFITREEFNKALGAIQNMFNSFQPSIQQQQLNNASVNESTVVTPPKEEFKFT